MNILVVGGGGREHAIIRKLRENKDIGTVYACPGNGGIGYDAICTGIGATDLDGICAFAAEKAVDFAVVAPDDPLALGLVDRLNALGIPAFGPDAKAARIEASKVFAKDLMKKYGIPTAKYETFTSPAAAMEYIRAEGKYPVVVKADGLALGKGVLICESEAEAETAVSDILEGGKFGKSGAQIVVEEFLTGPEVSVLAFTDGTAIAPMVSSMDHKRALDGDRGLNTGGMGTVAPNPYYTAEIAEECMRTIFLPTLEAMRSEGCPFRGCLYFGLMLTPDGPRVIEYNCRFGDPETQVVLPLLKTDLLTIMRATADGTLADVNVEWKEECAACVVIASGGYPEKYAKGKVISGLTMGQTALDDVNIFHAGTAEKNGELVTSGGRVLGVGATAPTLGEALKKAYAAADTITFEGAFRRNDIGARAMRALEEN